MFFFKKNGYDVMMKLYLEAEMFLYNRLFFGCQKNI